VNNNNIVWKNVDVVDDVPGTGRTGFTVANHGKEAQDVRLRFTMADAEPSLLDWGRVHVHLPADLAKALKKAKPRGTKWTGDASFALAERRAEVSLGRLPGGALVPVDVRLVAATNQSCCLWQ